MTNLNLKALTIMANCLGLNKHTTEYRNHYCIDEGHVNWDMVQYLVSQELMIENKPYEPSGRIFFSLTDKGRGVIHAYQNIFYIPKTIEVVEND